jgi:hypothetical protein
MREELLINDSGSRLFSLQARAEKSSLGDNKQY